jgi:hypothetical protein
MTLISMCVSVPPMFFVFYAFYVAPKESRRLVLPRISSFLIEIVLRRSIGECTKSEMHS